MKDFEGSFSNFIDGTEYDKAEDAIFALVRTAFQAGWLAAGGESPKPATQIETKYPNHSDSE